MDIIALTTHPQAEQRSRRPKPRCRGFIGRIRLFQAEAPSGPDWVYEIKTDGLPAQVHLRNGGNVLKGRQDFVPKKRLRRALDAFSF